MPAAAAEAEAPFPPPPSSSEEPYTQQNQLSVNSVGSSGSGSVRGNRSFRGQLAPIPSVGALGLGGEELLMRKQASVAFTDDELLDGFGPSAGEDDVEAAFARRRGSRRRGRGGVIPPTSACVYPVAVFVARLKRLFRFRRRRGQQEGAEKGVGIGELGPGEGVARSRADRERRRGSSDSLGSTVALGLSQASVASIAAEGQQPLQPFPAANLTYPAVLWAQPQQGGDMYAYGTLPRPVSRQRSGESGASDGRSSSSSFSFRPFSTTAGREEAKSQSQGQQGQQGYRKAGPASSSSSSSSGRAAAAGGKAAVWEAESDPGSDKEEKEGDEGWSPCPKIQRQISV